MSADAILHLQEQHDMADAITRLCSGQEELEGSLAEEHEALFNRIADVEGKLQQEVKEIRKEAKDDIRLVFDHLLEIRKTIGSSAMKLGSILSALIVLGLGALFGWLWMEIGGQKQEASMQRAEVLANTKIIAALVTEEKNRDAKANAKAREVLARHLAYDHRMLLRSMVEPDDQPPTPDADSVPP